MNAMSPLQTMDDQDCLYTYNLMPNEYGLRTRLGYRNWADGFGANNVRTIVPFKGDREDGTNDRLFAFNQLGIYDISTSQTVGAPTFPWASQTSSAGYAIWTHFTNDAAAHFVLAADEVNGLHQYEESTGLWTATTGLTGVTAADVFFVMSHKRRIWLIEKGKSEAWYLPAGASTGAATRFNFGAQFREGGTLIGLYSWTVDGGDGVDDYLVALSREGGVAVYRGSDPANASTWELVGVWYIGRVPAGNRPASQYGGQLFFTCERGLVNINRLIQGSSLEDASNVTTDKIARLVREQIDLTIFMRGWEIREIPSENAFVIDTPTQTGEAPIQYVRNFTTQGWGIWRGVPIVTGDSFQGRFYFADAAGNVHVMDGTLDGVAQDGSGGEPIDFSMLTSYREGMNFKRVQFVKPYFLSGGIPSFSTQVRYDYDLAENDGNLTFSATNAALWDSAIWDVDVWSGGVEPSQSLRGQQGLGTSYAVALKGQTGERLTLVGFTTMLEDGGLL